METYEYRVRPVVRYILTEFHSGQDKASGAGFIGSRVIGEFQTEECADRVCSAMQLGWGYGNQPPPADLVPSGVYDGNSKQINLAATVV